MSDNEIFHFDESGSEGGGEASFEAFKEKMKKASAQIAGIKKEEKKHKKKEQKLVKILEKFIKYSEKKELVMLLTRALEQNIPADFLLAVIFLGNEDVQEKAGEYLLIKAPGNMEEADEKSLAFFGDNEEFSLKVRFKLDNWIKNMLIQAEDSPHKLLKNAYDVEYIEMKDETLEDDNDEEEWDDEYNRKKEKKYIEKKILKVVLIQLIIFVMRDYFEQNNITRSYEKIHELAEIIIKGILAKTKENLDRRKAIEGDVAEDI